MGPMASLGHVAVAMAVSRADLGRFSWRHAVAYSAISMLPDADVLAFRFGFSPSSIVAHRGVTHSLLFAALCGAVALAAGASKRTTALVALTVASHPVLDALTNGGHGVAMLFPFSSARIFFPWRPLPVSPLGVGMFSHRGAWVMLLEAVVFAPFWLFGVWPSKRRVPVPVEVAAVLEDAPAE